MPATAQVTLASMPEELLERILALVLLPPPPAAASTARSSASHYAPVRSSPHPAPQPNPTASLLVSRAFYRVGTPLLYRHPILRSPRQADRFAATLTARPVLGTCIRALALDGTFPALKAIVKFCPTLERLDITVDNGALVGPSPRVANQTEEERADAHVRAFCSALSKLRSVRHLVLRKNAYLTQPRSVLVLEGLADAIQLWDDLESATLTFRPSPSPASSALAAALAKSPRLRVVRAHLPAVWNTLLLEISANPVLERIQLTPANELVGAHLFLAEARKHARLMELVRAGTPIMRTRANTSAALSGSGYAPSSRYGQPMQRTYGQPSERPYGQPTERSYAQPMQRTYGQPTERSYAQPMQRTYGQPAERMYTQPVERTYAQRGEQSYSGEAYAGSSAGHAVVRGRDEDGRVVRSVKAVRGVGQVRGMRRMSAV